MHDAFLKNLSARAAFYQGSGTNHEAQNFTGSLVIRPAHGGAALWFRATGDDGEIYHEELVLIGAAFNGGLTMTSLNSNIPAAQHFVSEMTSADEARFITPDFEKPRNFRERVTLLLNDSGITYSFAWGMPGQPIEDRSSATMIRTVGTPAGCPLSI